MPLSQDAVKPHIDTFSHKLAEFDRLKITLNEFEKPEKWQEVTAAFFRYRLLLKKLARMSEEDQGISFMVNKHLHKKGAGQFLDELDPENREKLIGELGKAMDPRSPVYRAALEELKNMMRNGQEIFDAGDKPRDGDPKSDEAIWGFTQIGPEHVQTQMHFVVCHFLERFMAKIFQSAGIDAAFHKDFLLNALADVLIMEHLSNNSFGEIFDMWNTRKQDGGLGWINNEKLKSYKEILTMEIKTGHEKAEADGISIDFKYRKHPEFISAQYHIHADGRGDEAMELVAKELQAVADKYKLRVVDKGMPTVEAMDHLYARTPGYKAVGRYDDGLSHWEKTFYPNTDSKS